MTAEDRIYLERALELAARGAGSTFPNPPVGAVVVKNGAIAGEGFHHRAGAAHAEVEALQATSDARGATLYVSLEPCNHAGKTPPCTRAVIDAGIARVVVGTLDPNPATNARGIAALERAGIAVEVADLPAARRLIEPFAEAIARTDRPYVALKLASSLDGYVASQSGVQQWLTGESARAFVRE
ncbi:MAG: bifunctional diaminohydroxyphosphoribosylaminopyrimidine deaminase/5-amino-6-(5-phosphoribosylamino)uracil reductase RibD, partial [Candidatus Eremiobacteraeota bacterium]|nr:bifunctional diaminohydroxyphosphoribosylaminopyrimidine deaminase/5-amino-6-(5-phosphoribosylamino)uracil reductase RibD [Candidatus Eremiobacteraeota bacterium]